MEDRLVIKDLWEYEERPEKGLLVKEATEAGVKKYSAVHVIDDIRDNIRKRSNDISGRNPFQQRRPAMSEAAAYKAEHDAPESEQGSFNSCSYTLGARSATLDHFGYYPLTRQRPTLSPALTDCPLRLVLRMVIP